MVAGLVQDLAFSFYVLSARRSLMLGLTELIGFEARTPGLGSERAIMFIRSREGAQRLLRMPPSCQKKQVTGERNRFHRWKLETHSKVPKQGKKNAKLKLKVGHIPLPTERHFTFWVAVKIYLMSSMFLLVVCRQARQ